MWGWLRRGWRSVAESGKGHGRFVDIAVVARIVSSLATFIVATAVLFQTREQRKARDDQDRP
ncbi:MAG: hypothetical protein M3122_06910 [Actinomycetota bacterium]|nr:hypothetical protein [Actinomycetota bacterium]